MLPYVYFCISSVICNYIIKKVSDNIKLLNKLFFEIQLDKKLYIIFKVN